MSSFLKLAPAILSLSGLAATPAFASADYDFFGGTASGGRCKDKSREERKLDPCCNKGYECKDVRSEERPADTIVRLNDADETLLKVRYTPQRFILKTSDRQDATPLNSFPKGTLVRLAELQILGQPDFRGTHAICLTTLGTEVTDLTIPNNERDSTLAYFSRRTASSAPLYSVRKESALPTLVGEVTQVPGSDEIQLTVKCSGSDVSARELAKNVRSFMTIDNMASRETLFTAVARSRSNEVLAWMDENSFPVAVPGTASEAAVNTSLRAPHDIFMIIQMGSQEFFLIFANGVQMREYGLVGGTLVNYGKKKFPTATFRYL